MTSFLSPTPVKICSYCYSQNTLDVAGFDSLRMDAWFCNKFCHNLALISSGTIRQSDNPDFFKEMVDARERLFYKKNDKGEKISIIDENRRKMKRDLRNKEIKIVKKMYEIPESDFDFDFEKNM